VGNTRGTTAIATPYVEAPLEPLGPDDVLDLTDDKRPRILRGVEPLVETKRSWLSIAAALGVVLITISITWHLGRRLLDGSLGPFMATYSFAVTIFVLSRFALAAIYRPAKTAGHQPSVTVVIPAFNEGATVVQSIDACVELEYPRDRLSIICIDDGSTDDTAVHIAKAVHRHRDRDVRQLCMGTNRGKRAAMATGIRATDADIVVFIDSDSHPAPDAVRKIVQAFADPRVGAVAGLTYVRNAHTNLLTRMQAVRYFMSFRLLKAAESVVGAVTCCSGCFAAYRRQAIADDLDAWENQRFLGAACTYGDDRALTNLLLRRGWTCRYADDAEAWTDAPDDYGKFMRQQLRWKKSWTRESPRLLAHLWRTRPIAFPFALTGVVASLLSPFVIGYHLGLAVIADHSTLAVYLVGLYLVAMAYALVYRSLRDDGLWWCALAGTAFYLAISPQLLWAMARIRDGSWGTRS
jgi:hyaluronan synthase